MEKKLNDKLTAEFKQNLKDLLEERKGETNAKKLSLAAGLGETAVRDILQNRSASPKLDTVSRLSKALDVPLLRLLPSLIDKTYEQITNMEEENRILREMNNLEYESLEDLRRKARDKNNNT